MATRVEVRRATRAGSGALGDSSSGAIGGGAIGGGTLSGTFGRRGMLGGTARHRRAGGVLGRQGGANRGGDSGGGDSGSGNGDEAAEAAMGGGGE